MKHTFLCLITFFSTPIIHSTPIKNKALQSPEQREDLRKKLIYAVTNYKNTYKNHMGIPLILPNTTKQDLIFNTLRTASEKERLIFNTLWTALTENKSTIIKCLVHLTGHGIYVQNFKNQLKHLQDNDKDFTQLLAPIVPLLCTSQSDQIKKQHPFLQPVVEIVLLKNTAGIEYKNYHKTIANCFIRNFKLLPGHKKSLYSLRNGLLAHVMNYLWQQEEYDHYLLNTLFHYALIESCNLNNPQALTLILKKIQNSYGGISVETYQDLLKASQDSPICKKTTLQTLYANCSNKDYLKTLTKNAQRQLRYLKYYDTYGHMGFYDWSCCQSPHFLAIEFDHTNILENCLLKLTTKHPQKEYFTITKELKQHSLLYDSPKALWFLLTQFPIKQKAYKELRQIAHQNKAHNCVDAITTFQELLYNFTQGQWTKRGIPFLPQELVLLIFSFVTPPPTNCIYLPSFEDKVHFKKFVIIENYFKRPKGSVKHKAL